MRLWLMFVCGFLPHFLSSFALADALENFQYVEGRVIWEHTKADFESEEAKGFTGISADVAMSFQQHFFARGDFEYSFRGDNNNQSYYNLGVGGVTRAQSWLIDVYGQLGIFGFVRNRETQQNVDGVNSSLVRRLDDAAYSLEAGFITELYPGKLRVAYRYMNVVEHMKDFILVGTYPWQNHYVLSFGYTHRSWEIQGGHLFSLGVRYNF